MQADTFGVGRVAAASQTVSGWEHRPLHRSPQPYSGQTLEFSGFTRLARKQTRSKSQQLRTESSRFHLHEVSCRVFYRVLFRGVFYAG